ncbi:ADP-ribose pyrophosphatase [Pseudohongiella nitratireducens]|uniref:ADP-ribose pyrophosphatase n=1 Tax=Pseudohongiella nitratireducens TaxID=1768907 RepID=A0A917GL57_9GAMM|nr:NUDIX domain-containing protein [Pseudohongiella nitratireducens]MDF1622179.1 NUDIX domain-containing protein [Pseudohongiella nitratireducens]GGG50813.1 ADP-ribose pyrophosphatase [Pseudohongiella nitratireducens]
MYRAEFSSKDIEVIERKTLFRRFFALESLTVRHRRYEGGWTEPFERELFCRGQAAGVLLHDPERNEIVMVEQFRIGLIDNVEESPWALELVAGMLDQAEDMETMARREIKEETGLQVQSVTPVCQYYNSPGGSDEKIHLYYAQVDSSQAGGIHGLASENEDIKVVVLSVSEVLAALHDGRINNAMAIIALQWFELNYGNKR